MKLDVEVEQGRVRLDGSREAESRACDQAAEGACLLEVRKGGGRVVGEAGGAFFVFGGKGHPGLKQFEFAAGLLECAFDAL
ncbi:hypothetical protein D3C86_1829260 [compost metagenome]